MIERLQKIIAARGVASRRAAEKMILSGHVYVNGRVAALGDKADPDTDLIEVNGKSLEKDSHLVYIMLNKPRGYITSMKDERDRRTVSDLVNAEVRVFPVGRLDYNSEGLLIMTNDGDITYKITHPSHDISKGYLVSVKGNLENALTTLQSPIMIKGRETKPAEISVLKENSEGGLLSVHIHEGRNRQIRRLCEAAGLDVLRLKRISIGELSLGKLPMGRWRYLEPDEISYLRGL